MNAYLSKENIIIALLILIAALKVYDLYRVGTLSYVDAPMFPPGTYANDHGGDLYGPPDYGTPVPRK